MLRKIGHSQGNPQKGDGGSGGSKNQAPVIPGHQEFLVEENTGVFLSDNFVEASDPEDHQLTYSIVGGKDAGVFSIDPSTGELTVTDPTALDFQSGGNNYKLVIKVTDDGQPPKFSVGAISIKVQEEVGGLLDLELTNDNVDEHTALGTVVGQVMVTSAEDAAAAASAEGAGFSLTDDAGGRFTIDAVTGEISVNSDLDHEVNGSYSVTVLMVDASGLATEKTFEILVNDINEAPTDLALSNSIIAEDAGLGALVGTVSVPAGADPDNQAVFLGPYSYSLTDSAGGLFEIDAATGDITLNGSLDFEVQGSYSVTVMVTDNGGPSFEKIFVLSVGDVNEAPEATGFATSIDQDSPAASLGFVSASDPDGSAPFNSLTFEITAGNDLGLFSIDADTGEVSSTGAFAQEQVGTHDLTVTVRDGGSPSLEDVVTVSITVLDGNDQPDAQPVSEITNEDAAVLMVDLLDGVVTSDNDPGDVLSITNLVQTGGPVTAFGIAGGVFSLDPAQFNHLAVGESEILTFSYTVDDGSGAANSSASNSITVTVEGRNDRPVATAVVDTTNEDSGVLAIDLLDGVAATDPDTSDVLSVSNVTQTGGALAAFSVVAGVFSLDPAQFDLLAEGESEVLTFSYTVDDGSGAANGSASNTITVTVEGRNDQPTASAVVDTTHEDAGLFSLDLLDGVITSDPDAADVLAVTNLAQTGGPAAVFGLAGGLFSLDPAQFDHLAEGESELLTFSYTVDDGSGTANNSASNTITLTVEGRNDQPAALAVVDSTHEDAALYSVNLLDGATTSDIDLTDSLSITNLVQTGGPAAAFGLAGGVFSLDPAQFNHLSLGDSEVLTFTYTVDDGSGAANSTNSNTITLTVEGRNDVPVATAVFDSTNEDAGIYNLNLLDGVITSDVDQNDVLTVSAFSQTDGRTISFSILNGVLSFDTDQFNDLAVGESEILVFSYTVDDGSGAPDSAAGNDITITVTGANDQPVATPGLASTNEDAGTFGYNLLNPLVVSDPDISDVLTVASVAQDVAASDRDLLGAFSVTGGVLSFDTNLFNDLAAGETETIVFSYVVDDGQGLANSTATNTLTVTIEGRDDAPVGLPDLDSLNGTNGFRIDGLASNDLLGAAVSSAGDVNGDGFDDIIVGAFGADPGAISNAGSSYVIFGQAGGWASTFDLSLLDGSNGFRLDGEALDDFSGHTVSSAGDVNGDGLDDLIIGADGPGTANAYIVLGQSSWAGSSGLGFFGCIDRPEDYGRPLRGILRSPFRQSAT